MSKEFDVNVLNDSFIFNYRYGYTSHDPFYSKEEEKHGFQVTRNGEVLQAEKYDTYFVFQGSFDDVEVKYLTIEDVFNGYTSDVEGLKDIDEEKYEMLSDNFKAKYRKIPAGKEEVEHDVKVASNYYDVSFDADKFLGNVTSELVGILYGEEYSPKASVDNLTPSSLSGSEVLAVLVHLYNKERKDLKQLKLNGKEVFTMWGRRDKNKPVEYEYITVDYFVKPYNGETTKRLSRKQNGQPYADRRGTMIPDYPKVASEVIIFEGDLRNFPKGKNDDETLEIVKSLYDTIFHP